MDKFRGKGGNWIENNQRVEQDILKFVVSYSMQEDETERGKLKLEKERNWSKGLWREMK